MSENQTEAAATPKAKTEVRAVTMTDGRVVNFGGKRKLSKETLIDPTLIEVDEAAGVIQIQYGAIKCRMDFENGETRTWAVPVKQIARLCGHGTEQKLGDNLASSASDPMSTEDMVVATDELTGDLDAGKWGKGRAEGGGGVAGAALIIQAIMEASGKDQATVKAFLDAKLAKDPALTRPALYNSFKVAGTKTGIIFARLQGEKLAKGAKVDADSALGELSA